MSEKPIRIQRKRAKGFNLQAESMARNGLPCVYVGRQADGWSGVGKFGNPFKIGGLYKIGKGGDGTFIWMQCFLDKHNDGTFIRVQTAEQSLEMYRQMMANYPLSEEKRDLLRGKNLACWCKESDACHADILLEIANK